MSNYYGMPLVSIIIDNYNYRQYVKAALESALLQTYERVEVIVVDDGSTDGSRDIILDFADKVTVVWKENGGQASAFNAGFKASRGQIVIFLDSDDVLMPDVVSRVVKAFSANCDLVRVQYRLEMIDERGRKSGKTIPPAHVKMASGDLRARVLYVHNHVYPPTSGNAFTTKVLDVMFPMPEFYRISADEYLLNYSVLLGGIFSLRLPGGYYRVHGHNHFYDKKLNFEKIRATIELTSRGFDCIHQRAQKLGLASYPISPIESRNVHFLSLLLVARKFDCIPPAGSSYNLVRMSLRGIRLSFLHYAHVRGKLKSAAWFVAMLFTWGTVAIFFARKRLYP